MEIRAEGEGERKSKMRVPNFDVMEIAGLKNKIANPCGGELVLIAEQQAVVVRRGSGAGGGQCALLDEIIGCVIQVEGAAQEPSRFLGLRKIQASGKERIVKRRRDRV